MDGKARNLKNRVYCLKCSPFKLHNTKKLISTCPITHKICCKCKQNKAVTEFYVRTNKRSYTSVCRSCIAKTVLERQRKIKQQAIDYLGGRCICCGYQDFYGSFDFHHINPQKKIFLCLNVLVYLLNLLKKN